MMTPMSQTRQSQTCQMPPRQQMSLSEDLHPQLTEQYLTQSQTPEHLHVLPLELAPWFAE